MSVITIAGSDTAIPCKGILFDKDGTLLDFIGMWGIWAKELFRLIENQLAVMGSHHHLPVSQWLGLYFDDDGQVIGYDKSGPIAMGTEEEVTALLASRLYDAGLPWNEAVMKVRELNTIAMSEVDRQKAARPLPGLIDFLASCTRAGIPLGVVTSDTTAAAIKHLEWMGIRHYFSSIVGTDRVIKGKPDPEMVSLALLEMGRMAEECVLIGDSNGDMIMAKLAGVRAAIGIAEEMAMGQQYLLDANIIVTGYRDMNVQCHRDRECGI